MPEPNGIDILCDAASSGLLQTSPSLSTALGDDQPPSKKVKRSDASSSSSSSYVCHICQRAYERADHLTRHLRSHENARPYLCTRCNKGFNRADLLTRHGATHDRDDGKSRPFIKRNDRATQACEACVTAKTKCDDQRPCGRCKTKKLVCKNPARAQTIKKSSFQDDRSVSAAPSLTPIMDSHVPTAQMFLNDSIQTPTFIPEILETENSLIDPILGSMPYFTPMQNLFQDIDLETTWDLDFEDFSIPQLGGQDPSPQASDLNHPSSTSSSHPRRAFRDPSIGHAAFKRYSPWLWEPNKQEDYVHQQKQGLALDEQALSQTPAFDKMMLKHSRKVNLKLQHRDRIFSLVLAQNKDVRKVPSFPTLELLNFLLHAHFVQDEQQMNSWIHAASLDLETTMPELLAAIISSGATFISVPAVWRFGLALHEIVRLALTDEYEARNASTRNLSVLQASLMWLELGKWCGFKRKMEIAESFFQPHLTMLRRAGTFSMPIDSSSTIPLPSDSPESLENKWRSFVSRESWKRLLLQFFIHDAQTSISVQTNPLISFTELVFSLPASNDLWRAPTAEAWRQIYLSKKRLSRPMPRLTEIMHNVNNLEEFQEIVDVELCYGVLIFGFWGQVAAYRETTHFYATANGNNNTHRLWLRSQHQELYHSLSTFSTIIHTSSSRKHSAELSMSLEVCLMILHVAPDELQIFAGKAGEDEARRVGTSLEENWVHTPEARYAIWHAGQVLSHAKRLPPATLRRFNAIAVYLASLTLWVYGLLGGITQLEDQDQTSIQTEIGAPGGQTPSKGPAKLILLDGEESMETKAFQQFDRGLPALATLRGETEPLSNSAAVLAIARDIFRENFPVKSEPLPPLVESLSNLLRDLGNGSAGMSSRMGSRMVSRLGSEVR
ncbi:hypothetical protein N0V93_009346 [Gnomoniopsis smithogilvyi]|uniref:Uncharacterized protein n=1 Tax=Gnomoniopsis smithogilvyi TaxID=1191159 RepID=A0A9W8YMM2_9PEZI|nr:hypothetical protein N0V93_009346 [Gnomoniopsis smithogilvyi]